MTSDPAKQPSLIPVAPMEDIGFRFYPGQGESTMGFLVPGQQKKTWNERIKKKNADESFSNENEWKLSVSFKDNIAAPRKKLISS